MSPLAFIIAAVALAKRRACRARLLTKVSGIAMLVLGAYLALVANLQPDRQKLRYR